MVRVVTASESQARDSAAIDSGIPSRALMQRAGAAAAGEIALRYPSLLHEGVLVYAGPGNNGGDGWVVARALAATGVPVRVCEITEPKTADARAERALALHAVSMGSWRGERIVVDAMLGTGATGAPRGSIAEAVERIADARRLGATIVAIDIPTGVDATTGASAGAVNADLTITFGTIKRGHLVARGACGSIVVVDIGLGAFADLEDGAASLVDARWLGTAIPAIAADAHKGTRRKIVILGGAEGMAGASILAARTAMRSGVGMVRLLVAPESLAAVQSAEPLALAGVWPRDDSALERELTSWADALVIGPGLGRSATAGDVLRRALTKFQGPVLLDADALNAFAGKVDELAKLIGNREALLTPHPAEFARLWGGTVDDVLARRFEIGNDLAQRSGATVLLKGVPTVVSAKGKRSLVSGSGTPALAAAGSGDILSGIAGTLLAQTGDALVAGASGAWVHGRAAELAPRDAGRAAWDAELDPDLDEVLDPGEPEGASRFPRPASRGITLDDVLSALPAVWRESPPVPRYPVLAELPAVGDAP